MWTELPRTVVPGFVTLLVTTTPMYDGTPLVGGGLFPPLVVQFPLQTFAGEVVGSVITPAKPLKADGASPPESEFSCHQVSAHQVTVEEPAAATVLSPSANAPRLGKAKTVAVVLSF